MPSILSLIYRNALKRMLGDYFFSCDVLRWANALQKRHSQPGTYLYFFDERSTANQWPRWMGVMHAYEIEYIFGVPVQRPELYTSFEIAFSRAMIKYWTNFAATG